MVTDLQMENVFKGHLQHAPVFFLHLVNTCILQNYLFDLIVTFHSVLLQISRNRVVKP